MVVERTLRRYGDRVVRVVTSERGQLFHAGLVGGLILTELTNGRLAEELGFDIDEASERILSHVQRIGGRLAHAAASVAYVTDPGGLAQAGAIGVGIGTDFGKPRREERSTTHIPKAILPGGSLPKDGVDRADRMYQIYRVEVPDTDGQEEKYHKLGDILNQLVVEGAHDPFVVAKAKEITVGAFGPEAKARALGDWVTRNVIYLHDEDAPYASLHPEFVEPEYNGALEVFQSAKRTLECGYGDCDCRVILFASMLRALGEYSLFRLVSQTNPDIYSHIYSVVPLQAGEYLAVDTTPVLNGDSYTFNDIGWECARTGQMDILCQPIPGKEIPWRPN